MTARRLDVQIIGKPHLAQMMNIFQHELDLKNFSKISKKTHFSELKTEKKFQNLYKTYHPTAEKFYYHAFAWFQVCILLHLLGNYERGHKIPRYCLNSKRGCPKSYLRSLHLLL